MTETKSDATEGAGGRTLTEPEVADIFDVCPATIARERKLRHIEALRPGRGKAVRYTPEAIAAYRNRIRQPVTADAADADLAEAALELACLGLPGPDPAEGK
jgi:hypothetical protein